MKDVILADNLRYLRKEKGLTQQEAALKIGVKLRALQSHESGQPPNRNNLQKYLDYYGCDRAWLLTGAGEPFPEKEKTSIREVDVTYGPFGPDVQIRTPLDQAINQIKALEEVENRAGVKKLILALADLLVDIDNDHKSMDNVNRTELLWKRLQSTEKDCASLRDEIVLLRQEIKQLRHLLPELQNTTLKKEREDSNL